MDTFYISKVTPEQKKHLRDQGLKITDWGDCSINVEVPTDQVDDFDTWCEDQTPPIIAELK